MVKERLENTNHEIVEISLDQMEKFCGNVREVENWKGYPVMIMSNQAYNAFTQEQKDILVCCFFVLSQCRTSFAQPKNK